MVFTIAVGVIERRAAMVAATIALLGLATLIVLPVESAHGDRGAMLVVAGLVVAGGMALRREDPWSAGARIGTGLLGTGLAVAALPWLETFGSLVEESFDSGDGSEGVLVAPVHDRGRSRPVVARGHRLRRSRGRRSPRPVVA